VEISRLHRSVTIVARGEIRPDEIMGAAQQLLEAQVPQFAKLVDVAGATADFQIEQVEKIATLLRGAADMKRGPVAFLISPERGDFARAFLALQEEFGSFDAYLWRFVEGTPLQNSWRSHTEIPACTALSDALSRDLKRRGFNFVGSTICYAFMQAVGLVNDHTTDCYRWSELR